MPHIDSKLMWFVCWLAEGKKNKKKINLELIKLLENVLTFYHKCVPLSKIDETSVFPPVELLMMPLSPGIFIRCVHNP